MAGRPGAWGHLFLQRNLARPDGWGHHPITQTRKLKHTEMKGLVLRPARPLSADFSTAQTSLRLLLFLLPSLFVATPGYQFLGPLVPVSGGCQELLFKTQSRPVHTTPPPRSQLTPVPINCIIRSLHRHLKKSPKINIVSGVPRDNHCQADT